MNRQQLAIGAALALLLSLGWWIRELSTPPEIRTPVTREAPAAIAEQLRVHTYDATGRLEQTLETPHMEHFEERNTSELSLPVLWRYTTDGPPWRMQAEQALSYNDEDRIYLPGEVIIDRSPDKRHPAYHMVTRDLTLKTDSAHATTDQPVLIESDHERVTAIGMEGWLKAPVKLHLLSQVRGKYEVD